MLSDQALSALCELEHGATFNTAHTISRELISSGLAIENWGRLAITESGRRLARSGKLQRFTISDDSSMADIWTHVEPRLQPQPQSDADGGQAVTEPVAAQPQPVPSDFIRGVRAAGVATGMSGIEVDAKWVHAFVKAWVEG